MGHRAYPMVGNFAPFHCREESLHIPTNCTTNCVQPTRGRRQRDDRSLAHLAEYLHRGAPAIKTRPRTVFCRTTALRSLYKCFPLEQTQRPGRGQTSRGSMILNKYLPLSKVLSHQYFMFVVYLHYMHYFHLKLLFGSRDINNYIFVEIDVIRSSCRIIYHV